MSTPFFSYRNLLFVGFTAVVLISTLVEITAEFDAGEQWLEMSDDIAMFIASVVILGMFFYDYLKQQRALGELRFQLNAMRGKLESLDESGKKITSQFQVVMQKQFDQWQLTNSEKDIALALIKGLSFQEIASLRQTREKTVRQQAASVYKKAGLNGRHELAGWFFEDLLGPGRKPSFDQPSTGQ